MAEAGVRSATAGDGLAVAWVQLEVWQTAFAEKLPAELLQMPPAELAQVWNAAVDAPGQALLVGYEGSTVVGFTQVARSETDEGTGEIRVLYVRPAWARRGHGGRLVAAAAAELRRRGATNGEWWIPEDDDATQRFARSIGWQVGDDARAFDTGKGYLAERRWTGTLDLHLAGVPTPR